MGIFNLHFRDQMGSSDVNVSTRSTVDELDNLTTIVSAWAEKEHNSDGTHKFSGSGYDTVPVGGTIQWHAGVATPTRWLLTDGSAVSRATYPLLFAKIGIIYGAGDGVSTFTLPSLNGGTPKYIILAGQ